MSLTVEEVQREALALSETNRMQLVTNLLESLPVPPGVLEEGTPEFEAELGRRCAEVQDGTAELIPYETVQQRMREIIANR